MNIFELTPYPNSRKVKKRKGRGPGSGLGKTAGRGHKGTKARGTVSRGFEGGQTPLHRRLPHRGFKNLFRTEYAVFNLLAFEKIKGFSDKNEVTVADYQNLGLIKRNELVKVLAQGELKRPLKIEAHAFSAEAIKKIEAAGGTATKVK